MSNEPDTSSELTKITVNLTPAAFRSLELQHEETGHTKTDLINRGIQVLEVVQKLLAEGGELYERSASGEFCRIHIE